MFLLAREVAALPTTNVPPAPAHELNDAGQDWVRALRTTADAGGPDPDDDE